MKLNEEQYNDSITKLADEIIGDMLEEKQAGYEGGEEMMTEGAMIADNAIEEKMAGYMSDEMEVEAGEELTVEEMEIRAREVLDYGLRKMAASEEMFAEGEAQMQACIETLAENGLYDENGLNKEAAESSEEAIDFTNRIAEHYEDAMNKQASAEEVYAESEIEVQAAVEVLQELGYSFE